jgi:hypothetical protein
LIDLQLFAEEEVSGEDKKLIEESLAPVDGVDAPEVKLDPENPPIPEPLKPEIPLEQAPPEKPEGLAKPEDLDPETPYGVPTTAQLNKINRFSKRKLTKEEVFVFPVTFVGDGLIVDRYVKLDESLLKVYLKDAKKGVAFMLNHSWSWSSKTPAYTWGRSFDAYIEESQGNPEAPDEAHLLKGWIYIVRGKEKDGLATDEIIKDIEDGTLFDGSIGFYYSTFECSICGKQIWECDHWPGNEYEVDGKKKVCYIIAKPPGGLMEYSGVFDGAYPGAGFSADGDPEPEMVEVTNLKEVKGDEKLFMTYSQRSGIRVFKKFEKPEKVEKTAPQIDEARAKEIAGANWTSTILDMADEGRILKADLIEDALTSGTKAMGNSFDIDLYKALFEKSSIDEIKRYRSQFMTKAKEDLPSTREVKPPVITSSATPPMAFKMSR